MCIIESLCHKQHNSSSIIILFDSAVFSDYTRRRAFWKSLHLYLLLSIEAPNSSHCSVMLIFHAECRLIFGVYVCMCVPVWGVCMCVCLCALRVYAFICLCVCVCACISVRLAVCLCVFVTVWVAFLFFFTCICSCCFHWPAWSHPRSLLRSPFSTGKKSRKAKWAVSRSESLSTREGQHLGRQVQRRHLRVSRFCALSQRAPQSHPACPGEEHCLSVWWRPAQTNCRKGSSITGFQMQQTHASPLFAAMWMDTN